MSFVTAVGLGDRELVSFVGAGGMKTTMSRLACESGNRDLEVAYMTMTHMPPPEGMPIRTTVAADVDPLSALADATFPIAVTREFVRDPDRVAEKVRGFDPPVVSLLFADGVAD